MLSHPAQNLHTDTGPNRRQQPTLPTAYDCSSKIPSPPTSPTDHSNLTRFRTAIRHEQVQSYESARAEDAIRLQQKYRSRPGSREGNQPINDAGCQDDHQQQHKIREAQQQRQARPGHYQYHQHQNTNEEQQDNQRTIRPSTSIGLEQHRGGRQRRARPKSIAILPAGLDDPHLHQWSPSGDASHQRLGNWAEEAAAFHSVASGESLSRSQTFIDSLSHDRSWDLTHQYGSQARAEILPHSASTTGGTPGLSRAKTITPMHQYMQQTLPPTPVSTPGHNYDFCVQSLQPGSGGFQVKTSGIHSPVPRYHAVPHLLSSQDSTTSFPKPSRETSIGWVSTVGQRHVTAVYHAPASPELSPLKPSGSVASPGSFQSQPGSACGDSGDSPESHYSHESASAEIDDLLPAFDFEGLRQAQLARSESCGSVQFTGVTSDEIYRYIAGPDVSNPKCAYSCTFPGCSKQFGRKENIKSHVQAHLGDRQFVCDVCNKRFVRGHDLKRHAITHSGVNPFDCPCGKKFGRHDALTRHRQRGGCVGAVEGTRKREEKKRGRPKKEGSAPATPKRKGKGSRNTNVNGNSPVPLSMMSSPIPDFDFNDFGSGALPTSPQRMIADIPLFAAEAGLNNAFAKYVAHDSRQTSPCPMTMPPLTTSFMLPPPPPPSTIISQLSSPSRLSHTGYTHSRNNSHVALSSIFSDNIGNDAIFSDPASPSFGYTSDFAGTTPGLSASSSPSMSHSHHFGRPASSGGFEKAMRSEMLIDEDDGMQFFDAGDETEEGHRRLSAVEEEPNGYDSLFGDERIMKVEELGFSRDFGSYEEMSGLFGLRAE